VFEGVAVGLATGHSVDEAIRAAATARPGNAMRQARPAVRAHSCKSPCVLEVRITWGRPQAAYIISAFPGPGGGWLFQAFAFAPFVVDCRCVRLAPVHKRALDASGLGDQPRWTFRGL
jgi:hypothetical protein